MLIQIFVLSVIFLIAYPIAKHINISLWYEYAAFYTFIIVAPVSLLSLKYLKRHKEFGDFRYRFLFGHFVLLLFLSVLYSVYFFVIANYVNSEYSMLYIYDGNPFYLKATMLSFIFFNGLVVPSWLQCGAAVRLRSGIIRRIFESKTNLESEYSEIKAEAKLIADEIKALGD